MKAKKHWGQNFLVNEKIVNKITKAADLKSADLVLEIGPGKGILTEELSKLARKVIAVEIDSELVLILQKKLVDRKNLFFIHGDILKINLPELLKKSFKNPDEYKVVANIPYYITGPILRLLLETELPPCEIVLMVQKEVAERITARPGKMSLLAISVQYYGDAEILFPVPKESFSPQPEVDSAVIKISLNRNQGTVNSNSRHDFFRVVRAGFSAKRKTLANNLASGFHLDKKSVENLLKINAFDTKVRAQELRIDDWKKLSFLIQRWIANSKK